MEDSKILKDLEDKPTQAELATSLNYELGSLVYFAYEMYDKHPGELRPALPTNFPTHKYKLKSYITFEDFFGPFKTRRFYGFVLQDISQPTTYYHVIRGTQGFLEWYDDGHISPVHYPHGGKVEDGFYDIYKSLKYLGPLGEEEIEEDDLMRELPEEVVNTSHPYLYVVGHSLGSALANLHALELAIKINNTRAVSLTTLACPLTGDQTFVNLLEKYVPINTRIVNIPDIVPDLPPFEGYTHVNTVYYINSKWYSNINQTYACYHSLQTYLYCLNPKNPFGLLSSCQNVGCDGSNE